MRFVLGAKRTMIASSSRSSSSSLDKRSEFMRKLWIVSHLVTSDLNTVTCSEAYKLESVTRRPELEVYREMLGRDEVMLERLVEEASSCEVEWEELASLVSLREEIQQTKIRIGYTLNPDCTRPASQNS